MLFYRNLLRFLIALLEVDTEKSSGQSGIACIIPGLQEADHGPLDFSPCCPIRRRTLSGSKIRRNAGGSGGWLHFGKDEELQAIRLGVDGVIALVKVSAFWGADAHVNCAEGES